MGAKGGISCSRARRMAVATGRLSAFVMPFFDFAEIERRCRKLNFLRVFEGQRPSTFPYAWAFSVSKKRRLRADWLL
ncbi:hypothetical protein GCM10011320_01480 [Neoroseomonas lacus]|uniref:Uncharacterized protein n=1 Tax=Neoroseomonas lacus TaxID=287609 RepID=A0A917K2G0_9PROT|nr:hypothetical protein GCM10011320_01480 [Neoroseomonas lacus]